MIILALGLQGSASTWLFNILRGIHQGNAHSFEAQHFDALRLANPPPAKNMIIKAHAIEHSLLNVLGAAGACAIVSTRDGRDGIASMMGRLDLDPVDATCNVLRAYAAVMTAPRMLQSKVFLYEDRFFEDIGSIFDLAEFFNLPLTFDVAQALERQFNIENVRKIVAEMPDSPDVDRDPESGRLYDRVTMFNQNHIGDTTSDKWREVIPATLHEHVENLFAGAALKRLAPGNRMQFDEPVFSGGNVYQPERVGPGLQFLSQCYLPAGRWMMRLTGSVPPHRNKSVYICHSGRIIGIGKLKRSGRVDLEIDYSNRAHDNALSIHIDDAEGTTIDPRRTGWLRLQCDLIAL